MAAFRSPRREPGGPASSGSWFDPLQETLHENLCRRQRLRRSGDRRLSGRLRHDCHRRRQGRRQDRRARAGRDPDLRAGPGRDRREERQGRAADLHHRPGAGHPRRQGGVHRGRHPAAARRPRRPLLRPPGGRGDRREPQRLQGGDHQVDGAGRHRPDGREGRAREVRRQPRLRGGLEPRVPARGLRARGLLPPRPGRDRRAHPAGGRRHARDLRAAQGRRRALRHRQHRVVRDDQVRLERLPRRQDHLRQRDRRALRARRRRRRGGGARHGPRQPHQPQVPPPRPRLRRLLLPQGHLRDRADRRGARHEVRDHRRRALGQRARAPAHGAQDRGAPSKASPARPSRCSASPSRATPTTCASRRRSRSSRGW